MAMDMVARAKGSPMMLPILMELRPPVRLESYWPFILLSEGE